MEIEKFEAIELVPPSPLMLDNQPKLMQNSEETPKETSVMNEKKPGVDFITVGICGRSLPKTGSCCHYCHTSKNKRDLVLCQCISCNILCCDKCMKKKFNYEMVEERKDWVCQVCTGECLCQRCCIRGPPKWFGKASEDWSQHPEKMCKSFGEKINEARVTLYFLPPVHIIFKDRRGKKPTIIEMVDPTDSERAIFREKLEEPSRAKKKEEEPRPKRTRSKRKKNKGTDSEGSETEDDEEKAKNKTLATAKSSNESNDQSTVITNDSNEVSGNNREQSNSSDQTTKEAPFNLDPLESNMQNGDPAVNSSHQNGNEERETEELNAKHKKQKIEEPPQTTMEENGTLDPSTIDQIQHEKEALQTSDLSQPEGSKVN